MQALEFVGQALNFLPVCFGHISRLWQAFCGKRDVVLLSSLPDELLFSLNQYLDKASLFALQKTSRQFKNHVNSYLTPDVCLTRGIYKKTAIQNHTRKITKIFQEPYLKQNHFSDFCYNQMSNMVVTGDYAEYDELINPINVWTAQGKNVSSCSCSYFFYKPIDFIAQNPATNQIAVVSRQLLQLLEVQNDGTVKEIARAQFHYLNEITCFHFLKDAFYFVNQEGVVFRVEHGNAIDVQKSIFMRFDRRDGRISWLHIDHEKNLLFVKVGSIIYVKNFLTNETICELKNLHFMIKPIYDDLGNHLIHVSHDGKQIKVFRSTTGEQLSEFVFFSEMIGEEAHDGSIESLHFDPASQQVFVGYETNDEKNKTCIAVWDIQTKKKTGSFPLKANMALFYLVTNIDYDNGILMTAGYGAQFWDVKTGRLLHAISSGRVSKVEWNKEKHKIFVLKERSESLEVFDFDFTAS